IAIKISLDGFDIVSKLNDVHSTNLDTFLSTNFDIEGHMTGNLELGASAESWSELNENINGTLEFSLDNGLWKENDIFYMLRRARAIYKRDEDPEYTEKTIKQEFNIQASGNIIDGIFVNDDFKMKMHYSNITGSGKINLSSMSIDYSIQAIFDDELKSALKMTHEEFLDFSKNPLPIRVRNQSGTLEFRPDIENIFRNDVEDALLEQEERLKESIRKNLTYQ
ncbi:MAG: AsmA-like C-terminal region-containing protein, partial [Pseudomonadota bacterium]|nr:AsmA-like C-terminal region-containing protein [Pseudomonadota bacterium]